MTVVDSNKKCFVNECVDPWKAQRLCRKHYKLYVRRGWEWPPKLPVPVCAMETCTDVVASHRGLCCKHRDRVRMWLRALKKVEENPLRRTVRIQEFWSHIDKTPGLGRDGDCWEWRGRCNNEGYGQFSLANCKWFVHRIAFKLTHGRIYRALWVLHSCDNALCVNPMHLRQGTPQDNSNDAGIRHRRARGTKVGGAKLDKNKVKDIRLQLQKGLTYQTIAQVFGVTSSAIGSIKRGKAWAWIE